MSADQLAGSRAAPARRPARKGRPLVKLSGVVLLPLLSAVIGIGGWEILVRILKPPTYLLPPPSLVVEQIVENWQLLLSELGATLIASAIGFVIAVTLGLAAGAAIAGSRTVDRMLTPWLVIAHAVPKVVIAPLFLVWFGFGLKSEILFVVTFTFFPVIVNTVIGLNSADPELLQLVRAMGAQSFQTLTKIRFPNALPSIFAGIKLSVTLAPVGAVIGEFVASNKGLGHLLIQSVGNMETPLAFAAVTVFSIFGVLIWKFAELMERLALPWHASQRERRRTLEQSQP